MFSCRFNPKQKKWEVLNEKKKVQRRVTTPEEADNIAGLLNAGLPLPRMRNRKPAAEAEQERLGLLAADERDDAGPAQKRARQVETYSETDKRAGSFKSGPGRGHTLQLRAESSIISPSKVQLLMMPRP